jgi:hypothetical protein
MAGQDTAAPRDSDQDSDPPSCRSGVKTNKAWDQQMFPPSLDGRIYAVQGHRHPDRSRQNV